MNAVPQSRPVCIVAPFGRDAESIASVLSGSGYLPVIHRSLSGLAEDIGEDTGAVLLTEEALAGDVSSLQSALAKQDAWSDIPFIVLRSRRSPLGGARSSLPSEVINVIELERPLGAASLLSATNSALRARAKQVVIRDQMARLEESQRALAESESELRLIADSLPVLIAFIDANLTYRFANLAYEEWFGVPITRVLGKHVETVLGPIAWAERREAIFVALSGRTVRMEVSWPRKDGQRRDAEIRYLPRFDEAGKVDGFHVFATDVTVRKVAFEATQQQAALLEQRVVERTAELEAEMAARASSEEALRQAQKMEAVGQLTGGIAHDFNNMLTGITAAMELMRMNIDEGRFESLGRFLDIASTSAHRAASLTQRLLAFSRRQTLDPRDVDVDALVRSMEDLLARTLGEGIELVTDLDASLPALVDHNQLESALLNLAINARDAMPNGGTLSVHTRLASFFEQDDEAEGDYILLTVGDTGTGMDKETLDRIFEPFFTTKPIGKGTGLGMSMIYGFVRQSRGHVKVDSTLGMGTSVRLYLPIADGSAEAGKTTLVAEVTQGAGQHILVVEDDPQVRTLVTELLAELGYTVTPVDCADAALPKLTAGGPLDLLITDVGLPGLNGRQLAEIARQSRPQLPVLFMTGYAESALTHAEFLEAGMSLLAKPFSLAAVSAAVGAIVPRPGH